MDVQTDEYRGNICKILVDGVDSNLEQIKAGMAWWYRQYAKDREVYELAEFNAKSGRMGLWDDKNPVAQWEWRRRCGNRLELVNFSAVARIAGGTLAAHCQPESGSYPQLRRIS
jgi:endonuclease YncB( thermonuclease family)